MFQEALVSLKKLLTLHLVFVKIIEFIVYDDACHLKKFAKNQKRAGLNEQTKQLATIEMVVDKMHMKGHIDKWCKENCDPHKFQQLEKVM